MATGSADVGLGVLSAARSLELDFLPLAREQYDLVVPRQHYESELLRPLLEVIHAPSFRRVVEAMGGYDVSRMGEIVYDS